jgi:hypothetical protein
MLGLILKVPTSIPCPVASQLLLRDVLSASESTKLFTAIVPTRRHAGLHNHF